MKIEGLKNFSAEIATLGKKGPNLCRYALYGGAEAVADAINDALFTIPCEPNHYVNEGSYITNQYTKPSKPPSFELMTASPEIVGELQKGLGISKMTEYDKIQVVIGFAGYSSIKTEKYSNGLPLQMIARSIESGSSVRAKFPFVHPAVKKSRAKAQKAMQQRADEFISRFKL